MKFLALYFSHFPSPPVCYTAVLYTAVCSQIYSLCLTGRTECEGCTVQTVELWLCALVLGVERADRVTGSVRAAQYRV